MATLDHSQTYHYKHLRKSFNGGSASPYLFDRSSVYHFKEAFLLGGWTVHSSGNGNGAFGLGDNIPT